MGGLIPIGPWFLNGCIGYASSGLHTELANQARFLDYAEKLYKMAHKNHPVTIWCRASKANFVWTLDLVDEMHTEWKYRYGHPETKQHKSYLIARYLREHMPPDESFEKEGLTQFALAMPDQYKTEDPVESYRNYYMSEEKQKIATWKKLREKPEWYITV